MSAGSGTVDFFPAIVRLAPPDSWDDFETFSTSGEYPQGTRKLDRCRVVHINGTLLIAIDSPEGPKLIFREKTTGFHKQDTGHASVITESGKVIAFSKDSNCGCGSRLRSWSPYKNGILYGNDVD